LECNHESAPRPNDFRFFGLWDTEVSRAAMRSAVDVTLVGLQVLAQDADRVISLR
jgi:hypothetical protein